MFNNFKIAGSLLKFVTFGKSKLLRFITHEHYISFDKLSSSSSEKSDRSDATRRRVTSRDAIEASVSVVVTPVSTRPTSGAAAARHRLLEARRRGPRFGPGPRKDPSAANDVAVDVRALDPDGVDHVQQVLGVHG